MFQYQGYRDYFFRSSAVPSIASPQSCGRFAASMSAARTTSPSPRIFSPSLAITRIYRGTFAAHDPLKFSEEVSFGGRHGRIVGLRRKDIKITEERYCQSVGLRVAFTARSLRPSDSHNKLWPTMMKRMMQLQLPNGQAHTIDLTTGAVTRNRLEFPGEVDCSLNLGHAWGNCAMHRQLPEAGCTCVA